MKEKSPEITVAFICTRCRKRFRAQVSGHNETPCCPRCKGYELQIQEHPIG